MGKFRTPRDRRQLTLLPPSVDDFVPADDDVRYVDAFVEALDLDSIAAAYSDNGRPAYSPQTLVKLLLYGRLRGERTGRGLQRIAEENLRFIWLLASEKPDFRTICDFRRRFAAQLGDLLRQTIEIGVSEGVIKLEQVAVDGTIIRASAGAKTFRTRVQLEKELAALDLSFEADVEADSDEQRDAGDDDTPPGRLPEHLRDPEHREESIRAALDEFDKAKREKRRLQRASTTDPESRIIKPRSGCHPSYNAQAAVDVGSGMIVGAYATNSVSDGAELAPMLKQIEQNVGKDPEIVLADCGYNGYAGLRALKERGIDGRIPPVRQRRDVYGLERFIYDEGQDNYRCPNGKTLIRKGYSKRNRRKIYKCSACEGCPHTSECIGMSNRNRTLTVADDYPLKVAMAAKMSDPEIRAAYRTRSASIEPVFGNVKANRRLRSFHVRGLARVSAEWRLEMVVTNLQKLLKRHFAGPGTLAPATG